MQKVGEKWMKYVSIFQVVTENIQTPVDQISDNRRVDEDRIMWIV